MAILGALAASHRRSDHLMSATNSQSLIHRWLLQNVQLYAQRDRVLADIEAVLARFNTIRPKSDEHSN